MTEQSSVATFTPTETRIYNVLMDGECHLMEELMRECFDDDLVERRTLITHVGNLKRKMPKGLQIDTVMPKGRVTGYKMSRKMTSQGNK